MAQLSVPLPLPLKFLALALLLAGLLLLGRRRFGTAPGVYGLLAGLFLSGLCGLLYPWYPKLARSGPFLLVAALTVVLAWLPVRYMRRLSRLAPARPVGGAVRVTVAYLLAPLAAFGACEWVSQRLWEQGSIPSYLPVRTNVPPGTSDFRIFHVVQDQFREVDPVLLWRTVPVAPYNSQRFRGPILATPKPRGVIRIMCYGDSNTDGPLADDAWPHQLHALLGAAPPRGVRYEVVNAGVSGYTSYQGLTRFKQEVGTYEPDIVLVSFGWNDAAGVLGKPDKAYAPPSRPVTLLLRALQNYRAYLSLRGYLAARLEAAGSPRLEPRVSIEDYAANLKAFVEVARAHGAEAVLLTRPHLETPATLASLPDWRRTVPEYNRAVLRVAGLEHAAAVDVQALFAHQRTMFVDQCHFTAEGHARLAGVLRDLLVERRPK
jgi:lysophospholipase L1-like esterase